MLNAVCPDGFEYYFVDEEFVVQPFLRTRIFTFVERLGFITKQPFSRYYK
jgi:hypothetical protein